jgi:serine protease Do
MTGEGVVPLASVISVRRFAFVVCMLGAFVAGVAQSKPPASERDKETGKAASMGSTVLHDLDEATDGVAERVLPAVVQVEVSGFAPRKHGGGNRSVIEKQRGIGSGVVVDPNGYIITNNHVVEGAQRIRVVFTSVTTELVPHKTSLLRRQHVYEAKLLGTHRFTDLALLKIEARDLSFIPLPEAYRARLGQSVLAVGSPQGLDHTISRGIVSAVGRQPDPDNPMIYIQTDAPINPGNSGGALVDRDGNLVGVNTFILTQSGGSEGLGFAIPEPTVRFVYQELKDHGHVRQTTIGANAQTITPTLAAGLKLPQDWGVIISDVLPGGPADKAGLNPRDIVVAVDNRVIDSLPKFAASLYLHPHDQAVEMDVLRGPDTTKLYVPAIEAQRGIERLSDLIDPQKNLVAPLGIFVLDLDASLADALPNLRSSSGIVVAAEVDYSPAIDADLVLGDVIRSVNGIKIVSTSDFRSELERFRPGDAVVLEVERKGQYQFVSFEME